MATNQNKITSNHSNLIYWITLYKLCYFAFIFVAVKLAPSFNYDRSGEYINWLHISEANLGSRYATWDGAHYLYLCKTGYVAGENHCSFYPLLPILIKLATTITFGNSLFAGFLLVNLFSIIGLYLFHSLVSENHGKETANYSLLFLLVFPGALFFSFIYTESLFFMLVMIFFTSLYRKKYLAVALIGLLLPLTKAIGFFLIVPLVWYLWVKREPWQTYLIALGLCLGYLSYFVIMYVFTGNPFEGFEAQKFFPNQPSIANILNLPGFFEAFIKFKNLHSARFSTIDRFFFILMIASLWPIWKLDKTYFLYALLVGVVPAMSNWFFSYTRFIMMCFPLFIIMAQYLKTKKLQPFLWYVAVILGGMQIWFLIRHINYRWTG